LIDETFCVSILCLGEFARLKDEGEEHQNGKEE
jgi:hypothetical protein